MNIVPKLGLGCVTFGREINKAESFKLLDYAYSNDIFFFDTAATYGSGASETILGEWVKDRKLSEDLIAVATKILPPFNMANVRKSVESSLTRLNLSKINVLYLHRWDEILERPGTWAVMNELLEEGKIGSLGVSNFSLAQLRNAINLQSKLGYQRIKLIQNNHNLAVSDIPPEMKLFCAENDISIITFSPLGAGFLTGKHRNGVLGGSRFDVIPAHQNVYFNDRSQRRLSRLLEVSANTGYSPEILALAWAIHQKGISYVLIGGRTIDHLDQAFKASKLNLPKIFSLLDE